MTEIADIPSTLRFAVFDLDLKTGELRRQGVRVPLNDKPFQVLKALVECPGDLVTRQELRDRLWSDTFVDFDNNLNAAVKRLRDALGDSVDSPRFIETLPRKGYRFIAPVDPIDPISAKPEPLVQEQEAEEKSLPTNRSTARFRSSYLIGTGAALAVILMICWIFWRAHSEKTGPMVGTPAKTVAPAKTMLVVLPFANLDGDGARDYIADGLTEELITQLGRLEPDRLGVIARTSAMAYKQTDKTVDRIGRELDVDYVLEGSIRGSSEELRATAQLILVADQTHLWAETYDRSLNDILAVQSEIAVRVAGSLALELLPDRPKAHARAATSNTEAYEEYLRGRFQWNQFNNDAHRFAIGHFERALELDPSFGHAWAGLADAYNLLAFGGQPPGEAFPKAISAALRALQLDRNLALAQNSLAFARLYYEWDFAGAEEAFRRSLELDPNAAMTHHWYTGLLSATGRHDEAIAACRKAVELDPVSLSVISDLGWYLVYADRPDEAIAECRRGLEMDVHYGTALSCLQEAYIQSGRFGEAVEVMRRRFGDQVDEIADPDPEVTVRRSWRRGLEHQLGQDRKGEGNPWDLAQAHARLGHVDEALADLARAIEARESWLIFLRVLPEFDGLHGDPRFEMLARRIGLPSRAKDPHQVDRAGQESGQQ